MQVEARQSKDDDLAWLAAIHTRMPFALTPLLPFPLVAPIIPSLPHLPPLSLTPCPPLPPLCPQVFGEIGWNSIRLLGNTSALLMMDTRSERTRETILTYNTWGAMQQQLLALPTTVRHVVVVATVPVIYPAVPNAVEAALMHLSGEGREEGGFLV